MRRLTTPSVSLSTWVALRHCAIKMASEQRDAVTKCLAAVREETKGQALDLTDMADAALAATRQLQDAIKKAPVDDAKFKGKTTTINASLKAYNTRLANLQNEARSIQAEVDALIRLMWGTDAPKMPAGTAPPTPQPPITPGDGASPAKRAEDFQCDVPPIARRLEQINEHPAEPSRSTTTSNHGTAKPKEVVEGEVIRSETPKKREGKVSEAQTELEVETIDIEIETDEAPQTKSPADTMSITEITKDLYERGINFADCLDAKSLRQRYRDVLAGRVNPPAPPKSTPDRSASYNTTSQPPPPPRPQYQQQQQQSNTTETGIAHDPHPGADRRMIDPMKFVWEVKQEFSKEKGVDPNNVALWSGKTLLEDHKRLYDYPSIQSFPIEVRQKGDIPR